MTAGVGVERASSAWPDPAVWVPDLAVGWAFLAAGVLSWRCHRAVSGLLAVTGLAWLTGTAWSSLAYLHRGALIHLALAAPGWWPRSRAGRAVVAGGYLLALSPRVWRSDPLSIAVVIGVLVLSVRDRGSEGPEGPEGPSALSGPSGLSAPGRTLGILVAAGLAVVVTGSALIRTVADRPEGATWALAWYQLGMVWLALACAFRAAGTAPGSMTDLVVELGEEPSGPVEAALRSAIGDPTLVIGYRSSDGGYADSAGRPVEIPDGTGERVVTAIDDGTGTVAVLVHDASVDADAALMEAVGVAARLRATGATLTSELDARLTELAASRRRLLVVADEERRQLGDRVRAGPERVLVDLGRRLADLDVPDGELAELTREAQRQLTAMLTDLDQIAEGLHPRDLAEGLDAALTRLAARCPLPVVVTVEGAEHVVDPVATACYYVCAEALANSAKHAQASRVVVSLRATPDRVRLAVADDGVGGADIAAGSGLRGLVDRVEALDGHLAVDSPGGAGTSLVAQLPLGDQARG